MRYKEFRVDEIFSKFVQGAISGGDLASLSSPFSTKSSDKKSADDASSDNTSDTPSTDNKDQSTKPSSGEILPVSGPISSPFGRRASGMHLGTDFAVPIGTPVKAPQDGIISRTGQDNMNGIFVEINSGNTVHLLLHLSKSKVSSGENVKQGQVVALSGNTGYSTGPHLHWSKRIAGRPVDPMANVG